MPKITSNAKWTKINKSQDTHETERSARGISQSLVDTYHAGKPCDIRGVCLEAWVEVDGIKKEHYKQRQL